ncbi:MAG: hypothetical protein ACFCUU_11370 [Cyclobacteriaceae bacterium]
MAPIYIAEKYWDRLMILVKEENSLSGTLHYHTHLVKVYPEELLEIYLPAFEKEGDIANGRDSYAQLAYQMKLVMDEIPEGKAKIKEIARKLIEKYPRRPAMKEELGRLLR